MNNPQELKIRLKRKATENDSDPKQQQPTLSTHKEFPSVYCGAVLHTLVYLKMVEVGTHVKETLTKKLRQRMEGKCSAEGYIKPHSIEIISYSSGLLTPQGVEFQLVYRCEICNPSEGLLIQCVVKTITDAGIHAEKKDEEGNIPITVFVSRDHYYDETDLSEITENTTIVVRIVGVKFELNNPSIYALGIREP